MTTTQQTTIQTIGLGTIEHRSPELLPPASTKAHYDYWKDFSSGVIPQLGFEIPSDSLHLFEEKAAHAKVVAEVVQDPSDVSGLRLVHTGKRISVFSTAIKHWSDEFGNFNDRPDAKPTFIKAAGLVLQEQIGVWGGYESSFDKPVKPADISLGALAKLIGTVPYEGIRYVLLAGELIHKAAWLEKNNSDEQERLFNLALDMYRRVIRAGSNHKLDYSADVIKAAEYSIDIKFYLAQKRYQEAKAYGKPVDVANAVNNMRQLIASEASHALSSVNSSWREDGRVIKGVMAERFMPLLIRDSIISAIYKGESDESGFFSVRSVFGHEDVSPPSLNIPKSGFDMVMQRFVGDDKVITTPVQIKFNGRNGLDRNKEYLPGIIVVSSNGIRSTEIKQAIEALKKKYSKSGNADVVGSIGEVSGLRQRLSKDLLAA